MKNTEQVLYNTASVRTVQENNKIIYQVFVDYIDRENCIHTHKVYQSSEKEMAEATCKIVSKGYLNFFFHSELKRDTVKVIETGAIGNFDYLYSVEAEIKMPEWLFFSYLSVFGLRTRNDCAVIANMLYLGELNIIID